MKRLVAAVLSFLAVIVAAVSAAEATPGSPVTIETELSFSSVPFSGSFTVPVGSSTLGCSAGTFVDFPRGNGVIEKNLTCTSGSAAGDMFAVLFHPLIEGVPGPGDANGPWSVNSGTGNFATLHGEGSVSVVLTGPLSAEETLTGNIHFN